MGAGHRADVLPDHWSDMAAAGLPISDVRLRCVLRLRQADGSVVLGRVGALLLGKINHAVLREAAARRFRGQANRPKGGLAPAIKAMGGKQKGKRRYGLTRSTAEIAPPIKGYMTDREFEVVLDKMAEGHEHGRHPARAAHPGPRYSSFTWSATRIAAPS